MLSERPGVLWSVAAGSGTSAGALKVVGDLMFGGLQFVGALQGRLVCSPRPAGPWSWVEAAEADDVRPEHTRSGGRHKRPSFFALNAAVRQQDLEAVGEEVATVSRETLPLVGRGAGGG
jgi:hypothetical protein